MSNADVKKMALACLKREEGFSGEVYYDSLGFPTIGYGTKLGSKNAPLSEFTQKISKYDALGLMSDDVERVIESLERFRFFLCCSDTRKAILVCMAYQLGVAGLVKFKDMISAISVNDFDAACRHGLNSLWRKQCEARAAREMAVLRTNDFSKGYGNVITS